MTYRVEIIEDSISLDGIRLTTFQLEYPRYIHAELMTHRVFSRNASSSRAIPTEKLISTSLEKAVYPIRWGKNQSGMQASMEDLNDEDTIKAKEIWDRMATACAEGVRELSKLGLHKQWANRPLEWFGTISVIVTATEYDNWFELRYHTDAQPEIYNLASMMRKAMEDSSPKLVLPGLWHLPYVSEEERSKYTVDILLQLSTARCARVSYLTHDGQVPSVEKDIALYNRLVESRPLHASPCEHQATPTTSLEDRYKSNFRGWLQHRKLLEERFFKQ